MTPKFKAIVFYPKDDCKAKEYFEDIYEAAIFIIETTVGKSDFKVIHNSESQSSVYFLNTNSSIGIIKALN